MGTSQSSKGSPPNVPMVPPWVPDPPPDDEPPSDENQKEPEQQSPDESQQEPEQQQLVKPLSPPPQPIPVAPPGRFAGARRSLGSFARSGSDTSLRRGLSHYIRSGYGGSATAARRFGSTASTASALFRALAPATGQPGDRSTLDPALVAGHSVQEVMDAVVEAVRPADGTQDAEANRVAIRDALSDILTRFPDANFLDLTSDQRAYAIERYVAMDIFHRFDLDLGRTIRDKAPDVRTALARLKQVRDYVKEAVASAFRKVRNAGQALTAQNINAIVRAALAETFQVFEGYAE